MLYNHYPIESSSDLLTFEFESIGPKGSITKVVKYSEFDEGVFNLGFGDKNNQTGFISDLIATNNNDSQKVLITVAKTLYLFTEKYSDAIVIATGSTNARTRLYRIGITSNLIVVQQSFNIFGYVDGGWEPFQKNVNYKAFSVRRKQ